MATLAKFKLQGLPEPAKREVERAAAPERPRESTPTPSKKGSVIDLIASPKAKPAGPSVFFTENKKLTEN